MMPRESVPFCAGRRMFGRCVGIGVLIRGSSRPHKRNDRFGMFIFFAPFVGLRLEITRRVQSGVSHGGVECMELGLCTICCALLSSAFLSSSNLPHSSGECTT